ncbi:MAG: Rne/Rng family ribonuclease [Aquiluna sp.]|nr:Rne/Rng family ribonuclease [Aquiluna sp.]
MADKKEIPEKAVPKKPAVKKAADEKTVDKKIVVKKPAVKKEAAAKVVAKKDEPKKPLSMQLIFQAPDLPTPKVNPRSGKLAEEENVEAPTRSASTRPAPSRTRQRNKPEGEAKQNTAQNTADEPAEEKESGSTRVAAKRQRRKDSRDTGRRRTAVTESEFLARRESVDRRMVVREKDARVQIGVLEDGLLVEHYVAESQGGSLIGNVYLGKVQNVLPSMEAAFVDIGRGRNAVLYSGEVDWDAAETGNQPRRIELALKSGDQVLVQVTKDPVGQKGARLTSQISLPGRFLVYVPGGNMSGISRKLPEGERQRLKQILKHSLPEDAGVIVRTAAEGATEDQLTLDVERLKMQWENINSEVAKGKAPTLLHSEPDLLVKIIRDVFNEDFAELVVSGEESLETIRQYLESVAPELIERLVQYASGDDVFDNYRLGDQIIKALDRKVFLPSGGSLVIDRTEAMTVVDVNTGKFIGSGGNLEETVTKNNLEAAEELVRQLRLRDIGGIVVVDFIDMIQESNQEMVRRRLLECLSRDRTKNQVGEITSLGLVQMTRKKIGLGLLETFSEPCDCCAGRGVVVHDEPRFRMPEVSENKRTKKKEKTKPTVVKKIVTAEQADAFKSVVNQIASAGHSSDESVLQAKKEPEGKTEILNAVLDSLPDAENVPKPKRRRATSAGKLSITTE